MCKTMILWGTCLLLVLSQSVYAEASLGGFHFKATLSPGTASLRSVELPWSVLSNLQQEGQNDLQVYNADNQALPFAIRYLSASRQSAQQSKKLNMYPMEDIEKLGTILEKEATDGHYKTIKLVQTRQRYLIIDNAPLTEQEHPLPLQSLTLNWQDLDQWLPKKLMVEESDNLSEWQSVAIKRLPYNLSENGAVLESKALILKQPITQRFIRLSGAEDFEPLLKSLESVTAHYHLDVVNGLNWNTVVLKPTEKSNQFQYNVLPSVPTQQWRFADLTSGSLYKGQLSIYHEKYAAKKSARWHRAWPFLQYKLQTAAGVIESAAVDVSRWQNDTSAWYFDFDQWVDKRIYPTFSLGWKPMELVFVAQGNGPFEVRYGSHSIKAKVKLNLTGILGKVNPEKITVLETVQLSPVGEKEISGQYKYLLWFVLGTAVLMLLYMARGLLREMES